MIATHAAVIDITWYAREHGLEALREDAFTNVPGGLVSLDEVYRVLGPE